MSLFVKWQLTEGGEKFFLERVFSNEFCETKEVMENMTKWIASSVVECIEFQNLSFTDEMLMFTTSDHGQFISIVTWWFTANGEEQELSRSFSEMEEAMEDMAKRITSSAAERIEICPVVLTTEMLVKIVKAMGSVRVDKLEVMSCDFSSAREGSVCALISSFASLRDFTLNGCDLTSAQYTNELLLHCARRPELAKIYFHIQLLENEQQGGVDEFNPLDDGILALLFREVGESVDVSFRRALHADEIISDEFSKRLLEKAKEYAGANNVNLAIMRCNTEQQMDHLAEFHQFRRTVDARDYSPTKTIYELPAGGGGRKCTLTFREGSMLSPRMLRFESGEAAGQ